jgi:hypothetical protein
MHFGCTNDPNFIIGGNDGELITEWRKTYRCEIPFGIIYISYKWATGGNAL